MCVLQTASPLLPWATRLPPEPLSRGRAACPGPFWIARGASVPGSGWGKVSTHSSRGSWGDISKARNKWGSRKPGHLCSGDGEAPCGRDPTAPSQIDATGGTSFQGKAQLWSRRAELSLSVGDHPGRSGPLPVQRTTRPSVERSPSARRSLSHPASDTKPAHTALQAERPISPSEPTRARSTPSANRVADRGPAHRGGEPGSQAGGTAARAGTRVTDRRADDSGADPRTRSTEGGSPGGLGPHPAQSRSREHMALRQGPDPAPGVGALTQQASSREGTHFLGPPEQNTDGA